MKTISLNLTDDEVEMLGGWLGQMSDGVGENKRWCTDYWKNLDFDNGGISYNENAKPFKGKSDEEILELLGVRFIEITEEGMDYCSQSELYFDGDKRDEVILGQKVANSIVEKLMGDKDYFEVYDQEEYNNRCKQNDSYMEELNRKCMEGIDSFYNELADFTGDDSLRDPNKRRMDVDDFYKKLKELGGI